MLSPIVLGLLSYCSRCSCLRNHFYIGNTHEAAMWTLIGKNYTVDLERNTFIRRHTAPRSASFESNSVLSHVFFLTSQFKAIRGDNFGR